MSITRLSTYALFVNNFTNIILPVFEHQNELNFVAFLRVFCYYMSVIL